MKKGLCCFLLFLGMIVSGVFCVSTAFADSDEKVADPIAISTKLQETGSARVIVSFQLDDYESLRSASIAAKKNAMGSSSVSVKQAAAVQAEVSLAAAVKSGVSQVLQNVSSGSVELVRTFKTIPAAILIVDSAGLFALEDIDGVTHIQLDKKHKLQLPVETTPVRPALSDSIPLIGADEAWDQGYTGEGWYVAILDTGIRTTHEFFEGKNIIEACYTTKTDENPDARMCPNGEDNQTGEGAAALYDSANEGYDHGVHVAGIATGHKSDNSRNGVAKNADIIAVNVFSDGYEDEGVPASYYNDGDVIRGMEFVYSQQGAYQVAAVNMSIGYSLYDDESECDSDYSATKSAIDNLKNLGIAVVVAAGNNGACGYITDPACISSAIAVGATDKSDVKADFSNWKKDMVPLFAPGVAIMSSTGASDTSYEAWSGTSMATPVVAGTWAVLKQKNPDAGVDDILEALTSTAKHVTFDTCDNPTDIDRRISVIDALDQLYPVSDLKSDILWHNTENGRNAVWFMNGAVYLGIEMLDSTNPRWNMVGSGDFNNDGETDILWRESSKNATWYMDDVEMSSWTMIDEAPETWEVVGVADCNNDGDVDIYWQNQDSRKIAIWYMDGTEISETVISEYTQDAPWAIVGVADFNSDGSPDLLWRDPTSGENELWEMEGGVWTGTTDLLQSADTAWSVVGTGDFNGDGKSDILWRKSSTGDNCIWYMNDTEYSSHTIINQASSPWEIQGVGIFD